MPNPQTAMHHVRRFILRIGSFFRTGAGDAEFARELEAHLQLVQDDYAAQGLSPDAARAAACRAFGGQVEQVKLRQRDARSFRVLDESWLDLKLGLRMLFKYPGLSIVGGLAMAVAIAFGTAAFAFFYSYLYPTLPLPEGERIIALENWNVALNNESRQAAYDFTVWRHELTTVEDLGAFRSVGRNLIVPGGSVEPIIVAEITAAGFDVARTAPILGRPIVADDERLGAEPVLIIGHDVWQTRFAADRSVIGQQVRVGSTLHTIVGVMPEGFGFPMSHSYWAPLRLELARYPPGSGPALFIFGRLAHTATVEQAQAELSALGRRSATLHPQTHTQLRPQVLPFTYPLVDIQDVSLWQVTLMQGTITMLLVIVALNIAILVYARTATRHGEIAVRTALGASRTRIVGQLFIEALALAALSAVLGVAIARLALSQGQAIMNAEFGRMPFWMDGGIPPAAIVYVVGITVLAAVLAGVIPGLQATKQQVHGALRGLGGSTGMQLGRTWTMLIVVQVGVAVAGLPIVIATGWDEVRHATATPTFEADRYLGVRFALGELDPPPGVDADAHRQHALARLARVRAEMVSQAESEPWVADVSMATALPGGEVGARIEAEDGRTPAGGAGHVVKINHVAFDFFATFDAPMLTGRAFTPEETNAVIVNRTLAQRVFGTTDVLGRRVRYIASGNDQSDMPAEEWVEIVGVVRDLYSNPLSPETTSADVYFPLTAAQGSANLIVRIRGDAVGSFTARLREIATNLDPSLRVSAITLAESYRQDELALRLVAMVLGLIVMSVLLLSAAGIYALMSFTVARRRKEIGIRAALGAEPSRLMRSVFARAAGQLGMGLGLGLITVAALDATSSGDLLGGRQMLLLPAIALMMVLTGLLAALGPARRGLRIPPTQALREE